MIGTITGIFNRNFVLLSAYGMLALALSLMLVTNLPLYLEEAGWDSRAIGTILGSYFLTSLIVRPFVGREADRRGRKVIMLAGGVLLFLPLPLYLVPDSSAIILVARILQGIGWAMATTAAAALASEVVPQDRVGMGLGIFGVLNSLGFTFGPALGSYLLNAFGGEGLLLGAAGLAGGVVVCSLLLSPPTQRAPAAIRWADAARFVRPLARPLAATLFICFGYGACQTFLPLYARASDVTNPGVFFTVFSILSFGSRPVMGRISDVWGRVRTAWLLIVIIASTFGLLAYSASFPFLVTAGVMYGVGHGAIFTVLMALLADMTKREDRGLTYGLFGSAIDLGITSGTFVLGLTTGVIGYTGDFALAAILALVAIPLLYRTGPASGSQSVTP
ncbi:MAG: MFS transporter [Acidobacteria bacterium]|nr:MFS transporter [Acidobacteriota bacterium]